MTATSSIERACLGCFREEICGFRRSVMRDVQMRIVECEGLFVFYRVRRDELNTESGKTQYDDDNPDRSTRRSSPGPSVQRGRCDIADVDSCLSETLGGRAG